MSHRIARFALVALLSLGALTSVAPSSAQAQAKAFTAGRGSLAGGIRLGTDNLGLGLGVNGGYTLDMNVYLGGLFDYFFVDDGDANISGFGASADFDTDAWFLMFEGGYDFGVASSLVLRPTFALGIINVSAEGCATVPGFGEQCIDDSNSELEAGLGGQVLFDLGGLTLGGELRFMLAEAEELWLGASLGGVL
ncbi:MAG: autotransporter domain-containing protein [Myxococcales bacterium]|jgi:hypothetical protein